MTKISNPFRLLVLFYLMALSLSNFGQSKYQLTQHGEFVYDKDDRPYEYVGFIDGNHYMLFLNKKSSFMSIVELNQDFVPTNRSKIVLSKSDGELEVFVHSKLINSDLKILTRTLSTMDRTQKFHIKSVDLKSFKMSEPKEIGSSFFKLITTQDMQGYLVTSGFDSNKQLSLNFTERVNSKEAKFNAILLSEELEPIETKSIEIPHHFIQLYESHKEFYDPRRFNNTVYSLSHYKEKDEVCKFYLNRSGNVTHQELPTDFEESSLDGGDWWIEDDKLKIYGTVKFGTTVTPTMKGFFSAELDLNDSTKFSINTQFFTSEFLDDYMKSYDHDGYDLRTVENDKGIHMFGENFKEVLPMKDDGYLVVAERSNLNDLIFSKFSSNGSFEWMNYINHPNIQYKGKAFEWDFYEYDNIFINIKNDVLLLRNGHIEEFDDLDEFKNPKKYSRNYSINLFQIEPNGDIIKSVMIDFTNQSRYVMQPPYQFIIDNKTALIYSINENDEQKIRFMTLNATK